MLADPLHEDAHQGVRFTRMSCFLGRWPIARHHTVIARHHTLLVYMVYEGN